MSETLVLHGMNSPNVTKVILMLEECSLDYELRHTAVFNQEQFTPEFLMLNPLGKVPVLEDPKLGIPLAESGAILFWLAEREGRFFPIDQPARAEVMQWLMVQMANIGPMLGQFTHFNLVPKDSQPYAHARYGAIAEKLNRLLDDRLRSRRWLAGDVYSIADMALGALRRATRLRSGAVPRPGGVAATDRGQTGRPTRSGKSGRSFRCRRDTHAKGRIVRGPRPVLQSHGERAGDRLLHRQRHVGRNVLVSRDA